MNEHHFEIKKTVRYCTVGQLDAQRKHLYVCLHGYGQLASFFAKSFEPYASKTRCFLVPEAPHRFYLDGTSGRVGASWMTKEDRLSDIEDQFLYLEKLLKSVLPKLSTNCKIHVLGFSQGVATAMRWLEKSNLNCQTIVCWAGTFPPDVNSIANHQRFKNTQIFGVFGDTDAFIPQEKAKEMLADWQNQGMAITPIYYEGGHKLIAPVLKNLIEEIEKSA